MAVTLDTPVIQLPGVGEVRAKKLEKLGLAAPQVTYVTHALKEKGWDIDTDATTVEEAKEAILKALKLPLKSMVSEKTDPGKGAAL